MSESTQFPSASSSSSPSTNSKRPFNFLVILLLPVILGVLVYQLDSFNPAPYPPHELTQSQPISAPKRNDKMLQGSEKIGYEELLAPEDLAYDPKLGVIYTGCDDGWVKRVTVNESTAIGDGAVVEDWINTGGRPLGLVNGHHGEVIIADAYKGLLNASEDGEVKVLAEEANGIKFKLTNAVDIAKDGTIYFTDTSYKYSINEANLEFLEGRPRGRLLTYDPSSKMAKLLLENLYFANGVAVSADNQFIIFCESPLRRCKKYYLHGEKKGVVEIFIENLPGQPDNIMYDGEGLYWIALCTGYTNTFQLSQKYPFIRKLMAIMMKYIEIPNNLYKNAGVIAVDLEGKPIAHYFDHKLSMTSSGIKIGNYLYCGSIKNNGITRLDLTRFPAVSVD